jgi:glycerophosphoryl diester phosphodiesterase
MIKIAHRGSRHGKVIDYRGNSNYYKFPENSLLSYINAIEQGFDMIEADVLLTKDNRLIMFRDIHIGGRYTKNITYKEIQQIKPHVPTFRQFCSLILPRIKIILDIKGDNTTVAALVDFFKKNNINLDNFYFSSFNRNHLTILHNYNNNLKLGLFYDGVLLDQEKKCIIDLVHLKFVCVNWHHLHKEEIEFYKKMNIQIFAWTNNNHVTRRLIPNNVDGIITDYYF